MEARPAPARRRVAALRADGRARAAHEEIAEREDGDQEQRQRSAAPQEERPRLAGGGADRNPEETVGIEQAAGARGGQPFGERRAIGGRRDRVGLQPDGEGGADQRRQHVGHDARATRPDEAEQAEHQDEADGRAEQAARGQRGIDGEPAPVGQQRQRIGDRQDEDGDRENGFQRDGEAARGEHRARRHGRGEHDVEIAARIERARGVGQRLRDDPRQDEQRRRADEGIERAPAVVEILERDIEREQRERVEEQDRRAEDERDLDRAGRAEEGAHAPARQREVVGCEPEEGGGRRAHQAARSTGAPVRRRKTSSSVADWLPACA
ncbi:MAG: hypothetical protein V9G24_01250 [Rhodoblastus sp.]